MKKFIATICILGSAATLAACSSNEKATTDETMPAPYSESRTVGHETPMKAEKVFRKVQTK